MNATPVGYKKILVPLDGSELANAALPHAMILAKACKAEVRLVEVVHSFEQDISFVSPHGLYPVPMMDAEIVSKDVEENVEFAKFRLAKIQDKFIKMGIKKVTIQVEKGDAKEVILQISEREHCDIIVIATHARSGLGRAFLGSITDYEVHHAVCPVLVVHAEQGGSHELS